MGLGPFLDDTQTSYESGQDSPLAFERFRCPVCNASYYTLEVLSAHMWVNGHGRLGSADNIGSGHRRGLSHATPLVSAGVAFTSTKELVLNFSNGVTTLQDVNAPSVAILPVVTTRVSAPGTASAIAAAPSNTFLDRPSTAAFSPANSLSATAMQRNTLRDRSAQTNHWRDYCAKSASSGQSQTPLLGINSTRVEPLKVSK